MLKSKKYSILSNISLSHYCNHEPIKSHLSSLQNYSTFTRLFHKVVPWFFLLLSLPRCARVYDFVRYPRLHVVLRSLPTQLSLNSVLPVSYLLLSFDRNALPNWRHKNTPFLEEVKSLGDNPATLPTIHRIVSLRIPRMLSIVLPCVQVHHVSSRDFRLNAVMIYLSQ